MIKFAVQRGNVLEGEARYVQDESSFDFERQTPVEEDDFAGWGGFTSLLVGTLQIQIDIARRTAIHVWGYHPQEAWIMGDVRPPAFHGDEVIVGSDINLIPGVSLAVAEIGEWTTTYDETSGWVSVRSDPAQTDDQSIMIASGTLLGLAGDSLNSIWVQPVFL